MLLLYHDSRASVITFVFVFLKRTNYRLPRDVFYLSQRCSSGKAINFANERLRKGTEPLERVSIVRLSVSHVNNIQEQILELHPARTPTLRAIESRAILFLEPD